VGEEELEGGREREIGGVDNPNEFRSSRAGGGVGASSSSVSTTSGEREGEGE